MEDTVRVSDQTHVTIPIRNLIALLVFTVGIVMGYFGLVNRISILERQVAVQSTFIDENSNFRIKWPLGELGALPDDMMQNAAIESIKDRMDDIKVLEDELREQQIELNKQKARVDTIWENAGQ